MSIQSEIDRINNNVQSTLNTISDTGVSVGTNSDALPAAAAALANEKADKTDLTAHTGDRSVHVTSEERASWNSKLDRLTWEYNQQLSCGSNGKVCIGVIGVYDTNVTISISSTTSSTYNATLVIATQNYYVKSATVYGDANNAITPLLTIVASDNVSGSAYYRKIAVYANFPGWSKNTVHMKVVNPFSSPASVLTSVTEIPTGNLFTPTNDIRSYVQSSVSGITPASIGAPTVAEMNAAIAAAGSGGGDFVVTFVDTESPDPETILLQADKTYGEILAASFDGKFVYAKYTVPDGFECILPLTIVDAGGILFSAFLGTETVSIVMLEELDGYGVFQYSDEMLTHLYDNNNPHNVTAEQVGAPTVAEMNAAINAVKYTHPTSHPASMITGLSTVATSGSYNDLTNKPTIPAAVTVDSSLSSSSTNPVQNKVVNSALSGKAPAYTYGTTDLTAGSSSLTTGVLYFVYE